MIWRFLGRLLFRFEALLWLLLIGLAVTAIAGMGTLVQALNYNLLIAVMLGGLLLGRVLARINVPWWLALLLMAGSGFTVVLLLVGHLLGPIWAAVQAALMVLFTLWQQQRLALPDPAPLQAAAQEFFQGSTVVLTRLGVFLTTLGKKGPTDPLPIQLIWGWALWMAITWTAYQVWQGSQTLVAVIPLGVLLTTAMFFTGIKSNTLLVFLFLALVLQAVNSWKQRQHHWEIRQMDWATDIAQDVAFAAAIIIMLSIFSSAVIPEISPAEIIKKFKFQQHLAETGGQRVDNMAAALGIERRAPLPTPAYQPIPIPSGLPRRHLLGSGEELSKQVVMLVKLSEPPPPPPEAIEFTGAEPATAFYWLGTTFSNYTGYGWTTGNLRSIDVDANQPQVKSPGPGRVATQTVRHLDPLGNFLYTTGFPLQVDQPSQINFRSNDDWIGTTLKTENIYTAQSWLSKTTPAQLRTAGTDYPEWIAQRYLQLPNNLPTRVRALALELTATAPTPYDRALAIEAYVRAFPYTLDVPTPPRNRDVADYFLFDLQKGYCDYYASSMAMLARAAGLPARFVIGYAPSPFDHRSGQYIVRESEAHSWVQIYFPKYGWIDFEPTGGRAALDREDEGGSKIAAIPTLPPDYDIEAALAAQLPWWENIPLWKIFVAALAIAGGMLLLSFLVIWVRDLRLARLPAAELIPILEGRLERSARLLGITLTNADTPLEFKTLLVNHLTDLGQRQPNLQQITPKTDEMTHLVNGFVGLRYSPHPITDEQSKNYLDIWRRLRWRLWGIIFITNVRRIK